MAMRDVAVSWLRGQYGVHLQPGGAESGPLLVHHVTTQVPATAHQKTRLLHDRRRLGAVFPMDPPCHQLAHYGQPKRHADAAGPRLRHRIRTQRNLQSECRRRTKKNNLKHPLSLNQPTPKAPPSQLQHKPPVLSKLKLCWYFPRQLTCHGSVNLEGNCLPSYR